MSANHQLRQAIDLLESQRSLLGDEVVDLATAPLLLKLASVPLPETPEGRGARKFVTVLFADLSGFTALSENLDPETVRDLMNACFEHLVPIVLRYEGLVDKFLGDGMMVLFGAPVTHENDPERALRTALEMMDELESFNAAHALNLGLHFGINTGTVVAGGLGTHDRQAYSVMGDVVNVAARLEHASSRGEILVGPETHRLAAPFFDFETLTPIQMKGKADPVAAYRLLGIKTLPGRARGITGLDSPLVGRAEQFAALQQKIDELRRGQGGVVTLWGEAGLGKSRLVSEFRLQTQALRNPAVQWAEGRCLSYGGAIAYLPWLEILRSLLQISQETAPDEALLALKNLLQTRCPDDAGRLYPVLGQLLSLPLEAAALEKLKKLDATALKAVTFQAMETLLAKMAEAAPLVLVGEDLHWADPTSLALWTELLPLVETVPLLLVAVMRPEREHPSWRLRQAAAEGHPSRHVDLPLEPLSAAESETLVGNLLHIEQLPLELRLKILKHAEGNPFYTEELIRALMDSGAIAFDEASGLWQAARSVAEIELPDTLQGVLVARIDRLQADTKRVLQLAAVIGRSFMYRVLAEIAREEQNLDERLTALTQQQMIRERARLPELEYIFKHQLTQEAAYQGLLKKERLEFHRQVAETLERLFPDRADELVGLLAYHWERAGEVEPALASLQRAAQLAFAQFANAEAAEYYERALALLPADRAADRYHLLRRLDSVCDFMGDRGRQAGVIEQIEALAEAAGNDAWRSGAALRRAHLYWNQGRFPEAIATAQEAIRLGEVVAEPRLQAEGYLTWGRSLMYQQIYPQAREVLLLGLPLAQQAGSRFVESLLLRNVGNVLSFLGESEPARAYVEQALAIHREQNDMTSEAAALNTLGLIRATTGDQTGALDYLHQALDLYRQNGHQYGQAMALGNIAEQYFESGKYDLALEYNHQARAQWDRAGNGDGVANMEIGLGRTYLQLGDYDAARERYQQALSLHEKHARLSGQAEALDGLGWIAENIGDYLEARRLFQREQDLREQLDNPAGRTQVQINLAFVEYRLGNFEIAAAAYRELEAALRPLKLSGTPWLLSEVLYRSALAAIQSGAAASALEQSGQALELAREHGRPKQQGLCLLTRGAALAQLNRPAEAAGDFTGALALFQAPGHPSTLRADALAGLAEIALAEGDLDQARTYLAELDPLLRSDPLYQALEPMQILLTHCRLRLALAVPGAEEALAAALARLEACAALIAEPRQRQTYLERHSAHRELRKLADQFNLKP